MTTHARSGMRRAFLGSVAEYVIARSPAPTVLTRHDVVAPSSVRTLLVAIDASCAASMSTVMEFVHGHDAHVVLLRVVDPRDLSMWQWQQGAALDEPQLVLAARQQLEDIASLLRDRGTCADAHVIIGSPVAVIDAFAQRIEADLIVMASHARTGAQRTLQGSVTDSVVRTASRPVLVVRLVPPPPGKPSALAVAHAVRHVPQ
jgi:nucleotide-binding universal stress UspA family protein